MIETPIQNQLPPLNRKERKALKRQQRLEADAAGQRQAKISRFSTWLVSLVVGLVVLYGLYVLIFPSGAPAAPPSATPAALTPDDWVKGPVEAKVTLIEYADFQCPACAAWQPTVNQLLTEFPNDLKISHRHFPLAQHKNAVPAAQAAEAAGRQGEFWAMADKLYETQTQWQNEPDPAAVFESYAESLGLSLGQFRNDYADPAVKRKINDQLAGGLAARINSTPSFFLNGQYLRQVSPEALKEAIRAAIENPS